MKPDIPGAYDDKLPVFTLRDENSHDKCVHRTANVAGTPPMALRVRRVLVPGMRRPMDKMRAYPPEAALSRRLIWRQWC